MAGKKSKSKKAGKSKGKKSGGLAVVQDGFSLPPLSVEVVKKIETLEKLREDEERERNYAQMERNRINDFYEITRHDLQRKEAKLRIKDSQIADIEERKMVELQVYKQKVKHLLYDHNNHVSEMKGEMQAERVKLQEVWKKRERDLREHIDGLKRQIREQAVSHEMLMKEKGKEHAKELEMMRKEAHRQLKEVVERNEKKTLSLLQEKEIKRKRDIHDIDDRKNKHIQQMLAHHEESYASIRFYYNDITCNSLDLLKALKEDVQMMRETEYHNEKLMIDLVEENRRMSSPLSLALKEVDALRQKLVQYDKDKAALSRLRMRLENTRKTYKNLEFDHEVLQQKFDNLQKEKEAMQEELDQKLYETKRIHDLKQQLSEQKVEVMRKSLEIRDSQIGECVLAAELKPGDVNKVNDKIEEVIRHKNCSIDQLRMDIAKVSKAHNDLIRVYEAKLLEHGIHPHTLGFRPLLTNVGVNPCGLVAGM